MDDIYANVEFDKPDNRGSSINSSSPRRSQRCHEAVVVSLALLNVLLLAVVIGLSIHCHNSDRKLSAMDESLQACDRRLSSMTDERNLMVVSLGDMTKKLYCLKRVCPSEWKKFDCSCYFFSKLKKTWPLSRQDCGSIGADLVVINSLEEQKFVSEAKEQYVWIGLSDVRTERTWKWTDNTPLTLSFWARNQPNGGAGTPHRGEEDCVRVHTNGSNWQENWFDWSCEKPQPFICEKKL